MDKESRKRAINSRAVAKGQLTRISTFLDNFEKGKGVIAINSRLKTLPNIKEKFEFAQEELELIDDIETHAEDRETFETKYFELETRMLELIDEEKNKSDMCQGSDNGQDLPSNHSLLERKGELRLPTIKLPQFAGNITQFRHFYDMFMSLVVNNEALDDIQRFHYLLSSLTSEAHSLIENLPIIGKNFDVAWNLICHRYNNPRLIAIAHIKHLLNLPTVNKQSASELRGLLNQTLSNMNAIKALDIEVPIHELLMSQLILERIDIASRKEWELQMSTSQHFSTLDNLCEFLESRCKALEAIQPDQIKANVTGNKSQDCSMKQTSLQRRSYVTTKDQCIFCKETHTLYRCSAFAQASVPQRIQFVKNNHLCFNCLREHQVRECRSHSCRLCHKKHHSLLHLDTIDNRMHQHQKGTTIDKGPVTLSENLNRSPQSTAVTYCSLKIKPQKEVLLSTALVKIRDGNGKLQTCRALLDSCSQSHFITENCVQRLKLKKERNRTSIHGIGESTSETKYSVFAEVHSNVQDYKFGINCSVIPKISGDLPSSYISHHEWNIPDNIQLADPNFYKPGRIDLLIGSEIFFHILRTGQLIRDMDHPVVQETNLGWIVAGRYRASTPCTDPARPQVARSFLLRSDDSLHQQLQRFWEIEELNQQPRTQMERECEQHFVQHTTRDSSGRFIVHLPLKQDPKELGDSHHMATTRFLKLEKRLNSQPELRDEYIRFMDEYETLGHMQLVDKPTTSTVNYYIPHHPVLKESSSTTKVRVVFDASAKSSNGTSLNDLLMVGPTIQSDLCSIIVRFRTHQVCFVADIAKMYRQIKVDPQYCNLQRILWRKEPNAPIRDYQLNTVTYGTASAPFLATRCLQQLAIEEAESYPKAAEIVLNDFYVDDCISGTQSIDEALSVQRELINLTNKGGFLLRKWCSNHSALLENVPEELRETRLPLQLNNENIRTLGLIWHPASDQFQIVNGLKTARSSVNSTIFTKRSVLSTIASIFDPLGLISPVVISCKIFLQRLWQENIDWDDHLTPQLLKCWQPLHDQLPLVDHIHIDRLALVKGIPTDIQIHGFSDASERAYGACIYLRSTNQNGETTVKLLCSKSKVAPLKRISLPRLELCAALLLARLFSKIATVLNKKINHSFLWTDSTLVLAWISSAPTRWKTFIANRVSEIQDSTSRAEWRHVASRDNPADLISRGINPDSLAQMSLWWDGPTWLQESSTAWPTTVILPASDDMPEQRKVVNSFVSTHQTDDITHRFSTLTRLKRVVSYCLRYASNCKLPPANRVTNSLHNEELLTSLHTCIAIAQGMTYSSEIQQLKSSQPLDKGSKLRNLNPFLCNKQLLRVGGRLQNAELPYDQKHQIILPSSHHVTTLIIEDEHHRMLHASGQLLLSSLRQHYWIINGKSTIRRVLHRCLVCQRLRAESTKQLMGQLPRIRVEPARPFLNVGIDYAGPIYVKTGSRRSKGKNKCYIAIFVCMSTRAIHIEVVSDMSTQAFLAALKRFVSRRGRCNNIYSDNGTNFIGAERELRELKNLFQQETHQSEILRYSQGEGITWHFIPPRAPHFGGIWEAGVKSFKYHLRRVMGTSCLTFEELTTLTTQIEACLNSRPLIPLSDDPHNPSFLTPGHFLIGTAITSIPEPDLNNVKLGLLSRWQRLQQQLRHFWQKWSSDYLNHLQQRTKWTSSCTNVQPGALCILKEDNMPPLCWRLAVIEEIHPGTDGLVRVATVRTSSGTFKRPISKICLLPTV